MVNILVHFIKSERTAHWSLYLTTVAAMLPYFFAMDRQNYARRLPSYLADMDSLAAAHPRVYEEFMSGGHAFMSEQTWPSSNRSMPTLKLRGGIVGISQTPTALNRWFLTVRERASIPSALKQMYDLQSNKQGVHKEATMKRVKRDEAF